MNGFKQLIAKSLEAREPQSAPEAPKQYSYTTGITTNHRVLEHSNFKQVSKRIHRNVDWIEARITELPPSALFEGLIKRCQLMTSKAQRTAFRALLEKNPLKSELSAKAQTTQFTALFMHWASEENPVAAKSKEPVVSKLRAMLARFTALRTSANAESVNRIIAEIKKQLETMTPGYPHQQGTVSKKKYSPGLKKIFKHYAQESLPLNKNPSFAELEKRYSRLTKGTFFKFCSDFNLVSKQLPLTKESILKTFASHADVHSHLDYAGFLNVLAEFAQAWFPAATEPVNAFYEILGCHDPDLYQPKLARYFAFHSPPPLLAKPREARRLLERWDMQKQRALDHLPELREPFNRRRSSLASKQPFSISVSTPQEASSVLNQSALS